MDDVPERMILLRALVKALDRWDDVAQLILRSDTDQEAKIGVARLLDVPLSTLDMLMDAQIGRALPSKRAEVRRQLADEERTYRSAGGGDSTREV